MQPIAAVPATQMYNIVVPAGLSTGSTFTASVGGQQMAIAVPEGATAGSTIQVQGPAAVQAVEAVPMVPTVQADAPVVVQGFAVTEAMGVEAMASTKADLVRILDANTAGILATVNNFTIKQRVKWWEALTQGCIEQANTYDVIDDRTGAHLFIAQEYSEDCNRCCCAPHHSFQV